MSQPLVSSQVATSAKSTKTLASVPATNANASANASSPALNQKTPNRNRAAADTTYLLEMLKDGVLVSLNISRPSFTAVLRHEDLAVIGTAPATTSKPQEASGDEAADEGDVAVEVPAEVAALLGQFQLGMKKLLPDVMYRRLDQAENAARRLLYSYSYSYRDTTRGSRFVAGTRFEEWEARNAKAQAHFWEVANEIIDNYPTLCEEVLQDYAKVASIVWRNRASKRLAALAQAGSVTEQALNELKADRASFVLAYLERVRRTLPSLEQVKAGFGYSYTVTSIALPLEIATNQAAADAIHRQEAEKRAELTAKIAALRAEEDKQQAEVWAKRTVEAEKARLEQEKERRVLELELARLDRAQKLQEAYLAQVKAQKDEMLNSFWTNLTEEINQTITESCAAALDALDNNEGKLPGRSRKGLVSMLEKLEAFRDYIQDEELAAKIEKLHAVMPPLHVSTIGQGQERVRVQVDTAPLRQVLDSMKREAQTVLIDLENTNIRSSVADAGSGEREGKGVGNLTGNNNRRSFDITDTRVASSEITSFRDGAARRRPSSDI